MLMSKCTINNKQNEVVSLSSGKLLNSFAIFLTCYRLNTKTINCNTQGTQGIAIKSLMINHNICATNNLIKKGEGIHQLLHLFAK